MEKQFNLKKILPYLVGIILFYIISYGYFSPVLEGKIIKSGDILTATAQQKAIADYHDKYNEWPKWTDALFSGMPTTFVYVSNSGDLLSYVRKLIQNIFGVYPVVPLILMMVGFFFLLLVLKVNPWLSIVGAIGYGFTTFFFTLLPAGHATQTYAFAYIAPLVASVIIAYKYNRWLGAALVAIFVSFELSTAHPQMAYYAMLIIAFYLVVEFILAIKERTWKKFVVTSVILALCGIVAVGTNMNIIYPQYEYQKHSIRSPSELVKTDENAIAVKVEKAKGSGLDYDYATAWSYGIDETFNILIPNLKGGAGQDYWGEQPFTSGPMYIGAIFFFLFILSLFLLKGTIRWWLSITTLISILLSWGHNSIIYDFFFYYVPLFNKFRNPSWSLIIAIITVPVGATLALQAIISGEYLKDKIKKSLYYSAGIVGGICLLFWVAPGLAGDFEKQYKDKSGEEIPEYVVNAQQYSQQSGEAYNQQLLNSFQNIQDDIMQKRKDALRKDAFRSFILILLSFILILISLSNKGFVKKYLILLIGLLILIDLWGINKRYVNNDSFSRKKKEIIQSFKPNKIIASLENNNRNFRVLNLTMQLDQDSHTMFFHPSIGGYNGAKMRRYQELIDYYLGNEFMKLRANLKYYDTVLASMPVINMLNTKYLIYNNDAPPLENRHRFGPAWFVKNVEWAANANEEIEKLGTVNLAETAVVNSKFRNELKFVPGNVSQTGGNIIVESYKMDDIFYNITSNENSLVVFSELYYPDWHAFVDGNEVPVVQCNYVLRAIELPKGQHRVEFRYIAAEYKTGSTIAYISSFLVIGILVVVILMGLKKNKSNAHNVS